jgi:NAD(P)-dependent dehydrogenase (short-subunit alcohol dehydrogenase family)
MAAPRYALKDRVVLVTGAARGIGAATARRLVSLGARVALVGLEPAELQRLAAELGSSAIWIEADVSDRDAIEAAASETAGRWGGIDVAIANAGIGVRGSVLTVDPDAFDRVIEVNLLGVWRTVRACLPHVIERRGYLLNIASVAAIVQPPGMASYGAAKAGVEAFSNALRAEVAHRGVGVGVAYFSWLDTDLVRAARATGSFQAARAKLGGAAGRTYPVAAGVDAIVRGIERRAPVVFAPAWVRGLMLARGLLAPVVGRRAAADYAEIEALTEREVAQEPGGSPGVGPGGEAAFAARRTAARS